MKSSKPKLLGKVTASGSILLPSKVSDICRLRGGDKVTIQIDRDNKKIVLTYK